MNTTTRPPLDPDLAAAIATAPEVSGDLTLEALPFIRAQMAVAQPPTEVLLEGRNIVHTEHVVISSDGAEITVSVFRRGDHTDVTAPGVYLIHGGGMVVGTRMDNIGSFLDWVEEHDCVLASVEYRLAPEHPDPTPVEDCYAGLTWFAEHAVDFSFDADRLMIAGGSAGGGLAAGTALLARDRKGPKLAWQLLICPMLDDRNETVSSHQITDGVPWARPSNLAGWHALLGDRAGSEDVSVYAAPARADDLSGLPPTFIDVGDAEVFRDEAVAFAAKLWEAGINCELHVWAGGFHGFSLFQNASVANEAMIALNNWVCRQFSRLPR